MNDLRIKFITLVSDNNSNPSIMNGNPNKYKTQVYNITPLKLSEESLDIIYDYYYINYIPLGNPYKKYDEKQQYNNIVYYYLAWFEFFVKNNLSKTIHFVNKMLIKKLNSIKLIEFVAYISKKAKNDEKRKACLKMLIKNFNYNKAYHKLGKYYKNINK